MLIWSFTDAIRAVLQNGIAGARYGALIWVSAFH